MTQTDYVLIALTRPYPRSIAAISAETGIAKPNIRRIVHTLCRGQFAPRIWRVLSTLR